MNKNKFIIFMVVFFIIYFTGCANTVKYQFESSPSYTPTDDSITTIAVLSQHWTDYDIYCSGVNLEHARGILFDPKNDATKLVPKGDEWSKVEDRETYDRLITWTAGPFDYDGRLFRILNPDGQFVGYLYLNIDHSYMGARVVDENTIIFLPIRNSFLIIVSG